MYVFGYMSVYMSVSVSVYMPSGYINPEEQSPEGYTQTIFTGQYLAHPEICKGDMRDNTLKPLNR